MAIRDEILEEILKEYKNPEDLIGRDGILKDLTTRDIQDHLQEIYNVEVSADLISTVTDAVINDVKDWQNRPLDEVYPVLYLDATS